MGKYVVLILLLAPFLGFSQASTNIIEIDTAKHQGPWFWLKNPGRLWSGSTIATNRLDLDGGANSAFVTPYNFILALGDSCYDNIKVEYFNNFSTTNWTATMYDSNKVQLATYSFSRGFVDPASYTTMAGIPDTISNPVRFIIFTVSDPTNTDLRQFRIYGDPVAWCTPVPPENPPPTVRIDPGIYFMGGSAIDDKDTNYLKLSNGDPLYWTYRQPENVFVSAYNQDGTFSNQPFSFTYYGDLALRKMNFMKYHGIPVQIYYNGSCILTIPPTDSSATFPAKSASNNFKDIVKGSDSASYPQWVNTGRLWKALTAIWGRNTSAILTPDYNVYGTNTTKGQNKVIVCEIGNEDNKTWQGLTGYHSPKVLLQKVKMAYDSIKSVDPTMQVYLGAAFYMDSIFLKAMYWWNYWLYGTKVMPFDGVCFNQYLSTAYGGQPQGGGGYSGISPEQWQTTERITAYGIFLDKWMPGVKARWTEANYAVGSGSNYDVHSVTGFADSLVQANMLIRLLERVAAAHVVETVFSYFQTSDGSGDFASMYFVLEKFQGGGGSYSGSYRRPLWWWYATRGQTLKEYKGWSTMLIDGDSTGVTVSQYDHLTDPTKKTYYVCRGTYNGTTSSNYVVNLGATALTCNLITMAYNDENGVSTPLSITGGNVTIPSVNEGPQYLQVTFAPSGGNPDVLIRGRKVFIGN